MRSDLAALISGAALVALLSACGTATEAAKVPTVTATVTVTAPSTSESPGVESSSDPVTDPTEPAAAESSISTNFKVGDTAKIGDWQVTVTSVTMPTSKQVKSWNMFNDPPKDKYVLATYKAKYVGTERTADAQFGLTLKFGGTNGQVYDEASVVTPSDKADAPTEMRPGGTAKLDAIFDVPAAAVKGGVVTVEGMDENFQTVFADFAF